MCAYVLTHTHTHTHLSVNSNITHRMVCYGYSIEIRRQGRFDGSRCQSGRWEEGGDIPRVSPMIRLGGYGLLSHLPEHRSTLCIMLAPPPPSPAFVEKKRSSDLPKAKSTAARLQGSCD